MILLNAGWFFYCSYVSYVQYMQYILRCLVLIRGIDTTRLYGIRGKKNYPCKLLPIRTFFYFRMTCVLDFMIMYLYDILSYLIPFPLASVSPSSLTKTFTTPSSPTPFPPSFPSSNPGLIPKAKYLPSPEKLRAATLEL